MASVLWSYQLDGLLAIILESARTRDKTESHSGKCTCPVM